MAKGKKNNKQNQQNQTTGSANNKGKQEVVTIQAVQNSRNEAEFLQKKEKFLSDFMEEVTALEVEKEKLQKEIEKANSTAKELTDQVTALKQTKQNIQKEYDNHKKEYDNALKIIENADNKAKEIEDSAMMKAEIILDKAEKEKVQKLMEANDEIKEAWKAENEYLAQQLKECAEHEKELQEKESKLRKEKQNIEVQKEMIEEVREELREAKVRYDKASPALVSSLQLELQDEQEKYKVLFEKYKAISEQFSKAQLLLDEIKTEVRGENHTIQLNSVRDILEELQRMKEERDKIVAIYSEYPDDASIEKLKMTAQKIEKLEVEKEQLERERNRYKEEVVAFQNVSKELEVMQRSVEVTNALNEHLLQELEAHKTALESRTGDTCPTLSKVDTEVETIDFVHDIERRTQRMFIENLKELVVHIKNYAGSRKKEEQLFYTENDIRAFLAGMAVSRLLILQGMSGTGKSSLPRIFAEAISGFYRLIPVESSWRDRNELLGYYNDFNKKFNAKTFTVELYKSTKERCEEIPTFIVLDEMNLARMEYYFSDFLAILQEPDKSKWLIELVPFDMRTLPTELPKAIKEKMEKEKEDIYEIWEKIEKTRKGDTKVQITEEEKEKITQYLDKMGRLAGAKDLVDGRKIKITDNIWFVGTANRDESTMEISDKVYDRAQVVSLDKKAISEGNYKNTYQKFISIASLNKLFEQAKRNNKYQEKIIASLNELDEYLIEKFNDSFGNRIERQTIDFVAVFMEAGGSLEDALDYQISTKILRKIITTDNMEALMGLLDKTTPYKETQRLIEKRIKELM